LSGQDEPPQDGESECKGWVLVRIVQRCRGERSSRRGEAGLDSARGSSSAAEAVASHVRPSSLMAYPPLSFRETTAKRGCHPVHPRSPRCVNPCVLDAAKNRGASVRHCYSVIQHFPFLSASASSFDLSPSIRRAVCHPVLRITHPASRDQSHCPTLDPLNAADTSPNSQNKIDISVSAASRLTTHTQSAERRAHD
jgi:hypothetical protein